MSANLGPPPRTDFCGHQKKSKDFGCFIALKKLFSPTFADRGSDILQTCLQKVGFFTPSLTEEVASSMFVLYTDVIAEPSLAASSHVFLSMF